MRDVAAGRIGTARRLARRGRAAACTLLLLAMPAAAADMTARQMTEALVKADAARPLVLDAKDLRLLDLSGLDFKHARMQRADLFGVDLTASDLSGTDLSGARLDRAVVIRSNFSGAKLQNATLMRPTVYTDLKFDRAEAPRFTNADLSGTRITARLDGADFRGANLRFADVSPHEARGDISIMPHNSLRFCDFRGADLEGANLSYVALDFSRLEGASLRSARLRHAVLAMADLSGADLTGADLTDADLYGATLAGVKGLDTVIGFDTIRNLDKARR